MAEPLMAQLKRDSYYSAGSPVSMLGSTGGLKSLEKVTGTC